MMWIGGYSSLQNFTQEQFAEIRRNYSLRRSDRYTAMVLAAAEQAFASGAPIPDAPEDTGVIVAGSFGPHRTTCAFLDDLLDYREEDVMPTTFSHSVYNAAASYAASAFGCLGPEFSLTGFDSPFREALRQAELCISAGLCRRTLVIGIEERSLLTDRISEHIRELPPEGAGAFLLTGETTENGFGTLRLRKHGEENWFRLAERLAGTGKNSNTEF